MPPNTIPVALAKHRGIYQEEVVQLVKEAEEKTQRTRERFRKWYVECGLAKRLASLTWEAEERQKQHEIRVPLVTEQLAAGDIRYQKEHWRAPPVYLTYLWLLAFPDLATFLAPYRTSRFDRNWGALVGREAPYGPSRSRKTVNSLIQELARALREGKADYRLPFQWHEELQPWAVDHLLAFLRQYGESAFVTLALLDVAFEGSWACYRQTPCEWYVERWNIRSYPNFCLTDFPGIAGKDPLELLQFLKALNEQLRAKCIHNDALIRAFLPYFRIHDAYYRRPQNSYDALRYALGERHLRWLQKEAYFEHLKDCELYRFSAPLPVSDEFGMQRLLSRHRTLR